MTSEVSICNMALSEVGGNLITSLNDDSKEARLCNELYASSRDFVLEAKDWTWAVKRTTIPRLSEDPPFGFEGQYQLPSDTIRVLECFSNIAQFNTAREENPLYWEREEDRVLAQSTFSNTRGISSSPITTILENSNPAPNILYIRYVRRVVDPNRFSRGFTQSLSAYLAHLLAIPIQSSRALKDQLYALYERRLVEAGIADGLQGRTKVIRSSNLTRVRGR